MMEIVACCQQIKNPPSIPNTIPRTSQNTKTSISDVIPLSSWIFSDIMLVIMPGARSYLSNQLTCLQMMPYSKSRRKWQISFCPMTPKKAPLVPARIEENMFHSIQQIRPSLEYCKNSSLVKASSPKTFTYGMSGFKAAYFSLNSAPKYSMKSTILKPMKAPWKTIPSELTNATKHMAHVI